MNRPGSHDRPPPPPSGSLWLGFGLGWAVILLGHAAIWTFWISMYSYLGRLADHVVTLIWLLPWLILLGLAVMFVVQGKGRIALGMGIAAASIIGLILLLVAACFGLFAMSGLH